MRRQPFGIAQRVLDRQAHVGVAQLRHHRSIRELHERVHNALRVDYDVYLRIRQRKQPVRLDDLQALIEQRGRVYGDLGAHRPRRVPQGLRRCDCRQFLVGCRAERAAGCRQNDAPNCAGVLAAQTLPDSAMLAIGRQYRAAVRGSRCHDEVPGHDEGLFVRQRHVLSALEGRHGRARANHARRAHDG